MIEPPLDFTVFKAKFDKHGINPTLEGKHSHFNDKVEQLLALLHDNGNDKNKVNEIIEKDVKKYLSSIT